MPFEPEWPRSCHLTRLTAGTSWPRGRTVCRPGGAVRTGLGVCLGADAVETGAAVDWAIPARQERNAGLSPTGCANSRVHLPSSRPFDAGPVHSVAAGGATFWAPAGLIEQPFRCIELLLTSREDKLTAAFSTDQRLFRVKHLHPPGGTSCCLREHTVAANVCGRTRDQRVLRCNVP